MSKKTFIKIVALLVTLAGLFGFLLPAMLSSKNDFTPILAIAVLVAVIATAVYFVLNKIYDKFQLVKKESQK